MDKGSYLVFAQEFAQGSKKLSVSRTESTGRDQPVAGRVRRACDDAPLSFPVRLCDAPYLLECAGFRFHPDPQIFFAERRKRPPISGTKVTWLAPTSSWPLFSRPTPLPPVVDRQD